MVAGTWKIEPLTDIINQHFWKKVKPHPIGTLLFNAAIKLWSSTINNRLLHPPPAGNYNQLIFRLIMTKTINIITSSEIPNNFNLIANYFQSLYIFLIYHSFMAYNQIIRRPQLRMYGLCIFALKLLKALVLVIYNLGLTIGEKKLRCDQHVVGGKITMTVIQQTLSHCLLLCLTITLTKYLSAWTGFLSIFTCLPAYRTSAHPVIIIIFFVHQNKL